MVETEAGRGNAEADDGNESEPGPDDSGRDTSSPGKTDLGKSPGGRRSFIEQRRRAQIIDAGIDLLADSYGAASMHKIARHLGISTGVISYHFGNKANLIDAITEHIVTTAVEHMLPKILGSATARDGLRALIVSNLEFMADYPQQLQALVQIIRHDLSESGPGSYSEQPSQGVLDVEKVLTWGQSTGEFGDFDTLVVATSIRAAIDQVPTLLASRPDLDLPGYAEEMARLFDRATRTQPPLRQTHGTEEQGTQSQERTR